MEKTQSSVRASSIIKQIIFLIGFCLLFHCTSSHPSMAYFGRTGTNKTKSQTQVPTMPSPTEVAEPPLPPPHDLMDKTQWKIINSAGVVSSRFSTQDAFEGRSDDTIFRIDYQIREGGGYIILQRPFQGTLPDEYEFHIETKGESPNAAFEFKLVDDQGLNTWWFRNPDILFTPKWDSMDISQADFIHAWGPDGVHPLRRVSSLELALTFSKASQGTIYIRRMNIENKTAKTPPKIAVDADSIKIDLLRPRRLRALFLDWKDPIHAKSFHLSASEDGLKWRSMMKIDSTQGRTTYLRLPSKIVGNKGIFTTEKDVLRYLKIEHLQYINNKNIPELLDVRAFPDEVGRERFSFISTFAQDRPRGTLPKYLLGEQTYWAQIPMPETTPGKGPAFIPALLNEEGMLEVQPESLSFEPMLKEGSKLMTWASAQKRQLKLENSYLPIPSVTWNMDEMDLKITAFAPYHDSNPAVWVKYTITNNSKKTHKLDFILVARPIPVTPPWQFADPTAWMNTGVDAMNIHYVNISPSPVLNGLSKNESSALSSNIYYKNNIQIAPVAPQKGWQVGAQSFLSGPIDERIEKGIWPTAQSTEVQSGFPTGIFHRSILLKPGHQQVIYFVAKPKGPGKIDQLIRRDPEQQFVHTKNEWISLLNSVVIQGPEASQKALFTLKSALAQILGNRFGPSLQPGPRRYATSWIRDGAIMSSALLQMRISPPARAFLTWFAQFQRKDGFIPCCITKEKLDPPYIEYDSNGQFIYLSAEYFRFTRDLGLVQKLWPRLEKTANFIDELRRPSLQAEFQSDPHLKAYVGLLPASVSHEGYLGNPVHAYWDDFWALRGIKDLIYISNILKKDNLAKKYNEWSTSLNDSIFSSIEHTIVEKKINFIPASVELGDFDASATAMAISILGEADRLPRQELNNTVNMYWDILSERVYGISPATQYSAYELRMVEPLVRFGDRAKAYEAINFFLQDQKPEAWNQWPEITWRDSTLPTGIGDLPHTWIAAEYVRALRSFFAYEHEQDDSLYIADGIPDDWLNNKVPLQVKNLPTHYGSISFTLSGDAARGPQWNRKQKLHFRAQWHRPPTSIVFRIPQRCHINQVNSKYPFTLNPNRKSISFQGSRFEAIVDSQCTTHPDDAD